MGGTSGLVVTIRGVCGAVIFCGLFACSGCVCLCESVRVCCRSAWCCFYRNSAELEGVSGMCSDLNLARQLGRVVKAVD
jgi:hypothetical protein